MTDTSRRGFFGMAALAGVGAFASPLLATIAQARAQDGRKLRCAMSSAGLGGSWNVQGKAAAEKWGQLLNVEVVWFDGEHNVQTQRNKLDQVATEHWDFVALQPSSIGILVDPISRIIANGIPVIDMDTLIAPLDQSGVHTFLAPDNEFMGSAVTQALVTAIGGKGKVVMTQGALGHTGAQGRARGFESVVKNYPEIEVLDTQPADWDVSKVARIWGTLLTQHPQIDAAFFHNDDMALAAAEVMKRQGREGILLGGVDAMPPAITAVSEGRMHATVRNPSCRIHGYAIVAGVAAVVGGEKTGAGIPKNIVTDGPVVTKANAAGMQWMEDHFLI